MSSLGAIIGAMERHGDIHRAKLSDNWMQGRTAYGGASSALALAATEAAFPDLPPLRTAQVAFVGPLGGELKLRPTLLRQGRSASFVRVEVSSDEKLGLIALLLFATERHSAIHIAPSTIVPPPRGETLQAPPQIAFVQNFEVRDAGTIDRGFVRWARMVGEDGLSPAVELIAIGDILPPAALVAAPGPGPISTIAWQLDLLRPNPVSSDGWWLATAEAGHAENGLSAQSMTLHDSDGRLAAMASQQVALFL
ncbi:thioesterase family protein [Sphingomonas sp. LY29]|uniref:acyl-CoA thioesterase n=1 Tax=Sphingomonas sp. LY29 TaxID=3095341 RepID=UPI002D76BAA0|nr:thioesterase family protein [Sphingomonas sp. LY29]WRP26324.1 thioesterase family protein [Sphingomonas sp. LY29]